MKRNTSTLESREFDLLVVGGGIFGACAAADAAQRGLSVAVIDRGDFCSATSANSFKLVHGGIRYLQHLDTSRVRQSSAARSVFLRTAPHLVYPLPIVVPTYGYGAKSRWVMRAAMASYDALTFDRNRGIADPTRQIPRGTCLSRAEVVSRYPGLSQSGLTGAAVFCDGQMYNPPRIVLAFLRSAAELGAVAANYVEAKRLLCDGNRVFGVEARDALSGETLTIRAKVVLNAAGPYAERLLANALGQSLTPPTHWSRDAFFVVARRLIDGKCALSLKSRERDPDARLDRGGRHLFLTPWRDCTLVGVWHKVYRGHPDEYDLTTEELRDYINEINGAYDGLSLTLNDISRRHAGLIPFGENDPAAKDLRFGHRSRLVDHLDQHNLDGLVTLIGVRFTTAPTEAVKAVNLILNKLGRSAPSSTLDATPVYGGDVDDFDATVQAASRSIQGVDPKTANALVHNYGSEFKAISGYVQEDGKLASRIGSSHVIRAQVIHAARDEMAQTLGDVVWRRTDLATGDQPDKSSLRICGELMARELGWSEQRVDAEIEEVQERLDDVTPVDSAKTKSSRLSVLNL